MKMKLWRGLLLAVTLLFGGMAHAQSLSVPASFPSTAINPNVGTGQYWTAPTFTGTAMSAPTVGTTGNVSSVSGSSPSTAGVVHSLFVSLSPGVSGTTGATVTFALIDTTIWSPTGYIGAYNGIMFVRVPTGASSAIGFSAPAGFLLNPSDSYVIMVTSDDDIEWTGSATFTIQ